MIYLVIKLFYYYVFLSLSVLLSVLVIDKFLVLYSFIVIKVVGLDKNLFEDDIGYEVI